MVWNDRRSRTTALRPVMAFSITGLLLLCVAISWQVIFKSNHGVWPGSDILRGLLFGVAIGLEICALRLTKHARPSM